MKRTFGSEAIVALAEYDTDRDFLAVGGSALVLLAILLLLTGP